MIRTPRILRVGRFLLAMVAAAALVIGGGTVSASAATWIPISGTGSTWSQNALDQWRKNVAANYGMTVNYSGTGSSAGRRDFIQGTVDFAISEIPFQSRPEDGSAPEAPTTPYAYMPIVAGGTAFMYNLVIGGKRVTNLRLGGETITKIFTAKITNWNDPQIQADNPGLAMPNKPIVPVVRSDGSGSTAQFTLWMSKQYPALWNGYCAAVGRPSPCGLTSQFPPSGSMKAQNGSLGVSGYVKQAYGEGAITYVEYSYAKNAGFPVAKVLNKAGYYVEPTAPSVAVALMNAQINSDLTQILDGVYNSADKRTYPLSSYSYLIVPTAVGGIFTTDKGKTLAEFAKYMICEGQQQAPQLGYSPLPMNLVLAGMDQIKRIPGADVAGVDINKCNNPTFQAGDSPSNNRLAATAPQPAECDKQGTAQCTTGTGGAPQDTPTSGTGTGGSASGGTGGTGGTGGDAVVDDSASGFDENGVPLSNASSSGGAVSSPFDLPDSGFGPSVWLMIVAGLILVGVIVLPPLLSRRLRRETPPGL